MIIFYFLSLNFLIDKSKINKIKEYVPKDRINECIWFIPNSVSLLSNVWAGRNDKTIINWKGIDVPKKQIINFLNFIFATPQAGIFKILGIDESIKSINSK